MMRLIHDESFWTPIGAVVLLGCASCAAHSTTPDSADAGESAYTVAAAFDAKLAGLWSGPASQTLLGDFPLMNFDMRPADGHTLFGRTDFDAGNSLRFAFMIETVNGQDTLVYRNGGYFKSILRDTRASLVDHDDAKGTYHFCAEAGGCSYLDALWTFNDATHLTLDVHVKGNMHLLWQAMQKETRSLPGTYPADAQSQGMGTAPFPTLPQLTAAVSWSKPLTAPADVWVMLSTTACVSTTSCNISRAISTSAPAGATSASVTLEQLLPGTYNVVGVVDRNRNLATTLAPAQGDSVSNPYATITVAATGTTSVALPIVLDVP